MAEERGGAAGEGRHHPVAVHAGGGRGGGRTFRLEVVTPQRIVFSGEVESLVVPGQRGHIGFLPGHAPMVVGLRIGVIRFRHDGRLRRMATSGGFLEVAAGRATLIADTAEMAEEIDVLRAREALDRALARLRQRAADLDYARAQAAMQRALARLRAAGEEVRFE